MRFINRFYRILERKNYLAKMNNLPKHRGMGPQEARDPMQLHRVHRLKADPDHNSPGVPSDNEDLDETSA